MSTDRKKKDETDSSRRSRSWSVVPHPKTSDERTDCAHKWQGRSLQVMTFLKIDGELGDATRAFLESDELAKSCIFDKQFTNCQDHTHNSCWKCLWPPYDLNEGPLLCADRPGMEVIRCGWMCLSLLWSWLHEVGSRPRPSRRRRASGKNMRFISSVSGCIARPISVLEMNETCSRELRLSDHTRSHYKRDLSVSAIVSRQDLIGSRFSIIALLKRFGFKTPLLSCRVSLWPTAEILTTSTQ